MTGANGSKAVEPIELITSQEEGCYAFRTILAWCIVGLLGEKMGKTSLHCNIIKCSSVSTSQMEKHYIAVGTQVEDTGIIELLQKLYNEEFNEFQSEKKHGLFDELENLSAEDKQFMMMMMKNGA